MSANEELSGYGRYYLQNDSYGVAAYFFHRAIQQNVQDNNAWNGLVLAMSLMRKEGDSQTVLARFAFQQGLEYDRDMITFAMMLWQQNPRALAEWVRSVLQMRGITAQDKLTLNGLAVDLERAYQEFVDRYGADSKEVQSMASLQEVAGRPTELDWLLAHPIDQVYEAIKAWLEDDETVLTGVRMLCMLPDPRSEKLLRRVCRSEEIDSKIKTHSVLALRWLGIRGNAKIYKFQESFTINLDDPEPELTVSVPAIFKPALDRMKLWMAKEQGRVTAAEYVDYAFDDAAVIPEAIMQKVNDSDFPSIWQEVVHALIRAAYDQYYPLVPKVAGYRQWSAAFVMLIQEYAKGTGQGWPYGEPELYEVTVQHRNWLLSGSPDFYPSMKQ
jgi:hypothetical protein